VWEGHAPAHLRAVEDVLNSLLGRRDSLGLGGQLGLLGVDLCGGSERVSKAGQHQCARAAKTHLRVLDAAGTARAADEEVLPAVAVV